MKRLDLIAKGFAMGLADIVPGVSGGTVALITGIYDELVGTISSVSKETFQLLLKLEFRKLFFQLNGGFLVPLFLGILSAILLMARVMHFLMQEYAVYTWSLFFGLILASIYFIASLVPDFKRPLNLFFACTGTVIGYVVVSLIPVQTPDTFSMTFLAGAIAICAMILPGISGSFILLILGKYLTITSALKNPAASGSIELIAIFSLGCLIGLLSFSKLLNFLLQSYRSATMALLTGFMLGSLKKIWPWKEVIETRIIRGKTYILQEANILPTDLNQELFFALILILIGISLVLLLEYISRRGVSSAG